MKKNKFLEKYGRYSLTFHSIEDNTIYYEETVFNEDRKLVILSLEVDITKSIDGVVSLSKYETVDSLLISFKDVEFEINDV